MDGPKLTVPMDENERHLNWKIRLEFNGLDSNWTILESGQFPEINESSSFADRLSRSFETPSVIDDPPLSSTFSHDRLLWTWSSEENMKILSNFFEILAIFDHRKKHFVIIVKSAQFIGALIMSEDRDQSSSLIESDNDSEPAVQHQMNPRVEAKINALCAQTGLIMKQVKPSKVI